MPVRQRRVVALEVEVVELDDCDAVPGDEPVDQRRLARATGAGQKQHLRMRFAPHRLSGP